MYKLVYNQLGYNDKLGWRNKTKNSVSCKQIARNTTTGVLDTYVGYYLGVCIIFYSEIPDLG